MESLLEALASSPLLPLQELAECDFSVWLEWFSLWGPVFGLVSIQLS